MPCGGANIANVNEGGLNATPRGSRLVIALVGKMNVGKSSLLNAMVGEGTAIVDKTAGTTTDTVVKHYELLPFGAVTFYDTAGIDDEAKAGGADSLGSKRVSATLKALWRADMAVLVVDERGICAADTLLMARLRALDIPFVLVQNKADLGAGKPLQQIDMALAAERAEKSEIDALKRLIISKIPASFKEERGLLDGLVNAGELIALITPIDASAPKGRLILPQVQAVREILDKGAYPLLAKEMNSFVAGKAPALVVVDSQKLKETLAVAPVDIPLTTFSILFARAKGDLPFLVAGAKRIKALGAGDKVLIAEACSHNVQDDDIGRAKIPAAVRKVTGLSEDELSFDFAVGHDFPTDVEKYALVIHCGACMLGRAEMMRRLTELKRRGVAATNYGLALAEVAGVLDRVIAPFGLHLG